MGQRSSLLLTIRANASKDVIPAKTGVQNNAALELRAGFNYSGLHLYEETVLGFPLPLRERDRVRGKVVATHLLIQTKSAVVRQCSSKPYANARNEASASWSNANKSA